MLYIGNLLSERIFIHRIIRYFHLRILSTGPHPEQVYPRRPPTTETPQGHSQTGRGESIRGNQAWVGGPLSPRNHLYRFHLIPFYLGDAISPQFLQIRILPQRSLCDSAASR